MRADEFDPEGTENSQRFVALLSGNTITPVDFRLSDASRASIFSALSKMKPTPEKGAQTSFLIMLEKGLGHFATLKKQLKDARDEANVIARLERLFRDVERFKAGLKNALDNPAVTGQIERVMRPKTQEELIEQIECEDSKQPTTVKDELEWIQEYLATDLNPSIKGIIDEHRKIPPRHKPKDDLRASVILTTAHLIDEHLGVKAVTTLDSPFEQLIRILLQVLGWGIVEDLHKVIVSALNQKVQKSPD